MHPPFADFLLGLCEYGDEYILIPASDAAQLWMEENVPVNARREHNILVLAESDVTPLIQNLVAEGYTVRG